MKEQALVSFRRLGRSFQEHGFSPVARDCVQAVRDIDLDIEAGRTLGIVGESGCGKSTLGRMAVGLLEPSSGEVFVMGRPLYDRKAHTDYAAFRRGLAGRIQMIFQDPYLSLNPRMNIGRCVAEPLLCSQSGTAGSKWGRAEGSASENLCGRGGAGGRAYLRERVARVLEQVGLEADAARRYPHEFSGGQRQRIAIARALITAPDFVVCDEPTSSLDASVQSQVLNLLQDMQKELSLSYMFISHDLAVVRHMSDRLAVMYRGFLVEEGDAEAVFQKPCHPYTRLLLESVPGIENPGNGSRADCGDEGSAGEARPAAHDPSLAPQKKCRTVVRAPERPACPFAPRCSHVFSACLHAVPELTALCNPLGLSGSPPSHRRVRCLLYKEA